jgi:exodeoxyribonuclease VII small subunit
MASAKKQTFEKAMSQLEDIIKELESGDLPLEQSVKKFEEGILLSKFCSEKLDETEKKITVLLQDEAGNITEKPFPSDEDSSLRSE